MSKNIFFENAFVGTDNDELFQCPAFFRLHAQLGASYFELCNKVNTKALIHFSPVDSEGTWRSPAKGTFA